MGREATGGAFRYVFVAVHSLRANPLPYEVLLHFWRGTQHSLPASNRKFSTAIKNTVGRKSTSFVEWLNLIKAEVDAPDLRAAIGQERACPRRHPQTFHCRRTEATCPEAGRDRSLLAGRPTVRRRASSDRRNGIRILEGSSRRLGRKDRLNVL